MNKAYTPDDPMSSRRRLKCAFACAHYAKAATETSCARTATAGPRKQKDRAGRRLVATVLQTGAERTAERSKTGVGGVGRDGIWRVRRKILLQTGSRLDPRRGFFSRL